MDDYDDRDIGFDITAISDPTNPYGVRSGQRDYEIFNEGSVATRAVNHPGVPIWYGGEVLEQSIGLNTTNNVPVGFSTLQQLQDWINGGRPGAPTNGRRSILVTAPAGLSADSSSFETVKQTGVRNLPQGISGFRTTGCMVVGKPHRENFCPVYTGANWIHLQ
ncbi:MAG UNVERIFIED_CONTAM: hypothetical protein LVR18_49925 [Planctomycetaceae bacterium]|jgi:hypothetical protein